MKYAIVIPDGCADEPQESLGNRTPLQAANVPFMDQVAREGVVGESNNTPDALLPASDVCTLSLFGYDPLKYYTGRAPLEARAMNIDLGPSDWAIRCNLVTVVDGVMKDFSGGHVGTAFGRRYMQTVAEALGGDRLEFIPGVSYRNILVCRDLPGQSAPFSSETVTQAPHDIPDQPIANHQPKGPGSELLIELMNQSSKLLGPDHPVNAERRALGESPVTRIWLWGQGQAPKIDSFETVYGRRGAIVTAVDLLRGVGGFLGWDRLEVPTATGYLDTDYAAKGKRGVDALNQYDLVCVHVEAPDEASHEGRADAKVQALEEIDRHVVGPMLEALKSQDEWRILISPDHPTPLRTRTHGRGTVPWAVAGAGVPASGATYCEESGNQSTHKFDPGCRLMSWFLDQTS